MNKPTPNRLLRDLFAFALMAFCPSFLPAQSTESNPNSSGAAAETGHADSLKWSDRHFLRTAADENQKEIAFARLASQQAANPEVRRFAQQVATDHASMEQGLAQLAQQKDMKIEREMTFSSSTPGAYISPTASSANASGVESPGLGWSDDRQYNYLSHANGPDFDREFVEMMVDDHDYAVRLFEKKAQTADDPEVRAFAAKYLPALQQHLARAQSLLLSFK